MQTPGFRNSAKAPVAKRVKPTAEAFTKSPHLVAAILSAWAAANVEFRQRVYDLLTERGWELLPVDADRAQLPGFPILGFLPGDLAEKVDPYLRPLYDALHDMMRFEKVSALMEKGAIEVAPIAFMRGRTLNDSFIILDEAQNTTSEQMKMFLTRIGFNSKAVITGDITQIDLPPERTSGLIETKNILQGIEGIKFVFFSKQDVVRHRLVQEIIRAYEDLDARKRGGRGAPNAG